MAFRANMPPGFSRNLLVNLVITSNFEANVFLTKPMRLNSDGAGCGEGRSQARSQAHSPASNRRGAAGTAAQTSIQNFDAGVSTLKSRIKRIFS